MRNAVLDNGVEIRLIDNTYVVCKDGKMIIPNPLQRCAVLWYHRYLQHPGHTCLEETMKATIYWKGMHTSIWPWIKSCRACQVKKKQFEYRRLQFKTVITVPWRVLCFDLIGPYTLTGKDGIIIDFMVFAMIDPANSWFEIVELPLTHRLTTNAVHGKEPSIIEEIFDKTSECIAWLVNKMWLSRYPRCCYIVYDNSSGRLSKLV